MPEDQTEEGYRHQYLLQGIASGPANPEEIDEMERDLGIAFPVPYRAYLRVCGTHPPKSLVGSDCVMTDLRDNLAAAIEMLAEDRAEWQLPSKAVAFLMHQGYIFFYFDSAESHDPAVFRYHEGEQKPVRVEEHFSYWVMGL